MHGGSSRHPWGARQGARESQSVVNAKPTSEQCAMDASWRQANVATQGPPSFASKMCDREASPCKGMACDPKVVGYRSKKARNPFARNLVGRKAGTSEQRLAHSTFCLVDKVRCNTSNGRLTCHGFNSRLGHVAMWTSARDLAFGRITHDHLLIMRPLETRG